MKVKLNIRLSKEDIEWLKQYGIIQKEMYKRKNHYVLVVMTYKNKKGGRINRWKIKKDSEN